MSQYILYNIKYIELIYNNDLGYIHQLIHIFRGYPPLSSVSIHISCPKVIYFTNVKWLREDTRLINNVMCTYHDIPVHNDIAMGLF